MEQASTRNVSMFLCQSLVFDENLSIDDVITNVSMDVSMGSIKKK